MTRGRKRVLAGAGVTLGLLAVLGMTGLMVLRSNFFIEKVRLRIIDEAERAPAAAG